MKGFKGFDKNLCCRGFQYEVGKTYEMEETPIICERGFHFCESLIWVDSYYPLATKICIPFTDDSSLMFFNFRYCEVEAIGEIVSDEGCLYSKRATNKIRIVRELPIEEALHLLEPLYDIKFSEKERVEIYHHFLSKNLKEEFL